MPMPMKNIPAKIASARIVANRNDSTMNPNRTVRMPAARYHPHAFSAASASASPSTVSSTVRTSIMVPPCSLTPDAM